MNRSKTKLIVAVDFDGTLALGIKSHITLAVPNFDLINRLKELKANTNCYIKIVTARGAKGKLSEEEKIKKYKPLIQQFLTQYEVPCDELSFTKEYADLYIDDMTIGQYDSFTSTKSAFTENSIIITDHTIIKKCNTALFEKEWYDASRDLLNVPEVLFANDDTIITSKIIGDGPVVVEDYINLLSKFKNETIANYPYFTYTQNITIHKYSTSRVVDIIKNLPPLAPTFFHGDFCPSHIIKQNNKLFLIDPNYKRVFGNYITDAGKLFFSLIAYNRDFPAAEKVWKAFGNDVVPYAVAEGLRVCKYKDQYISIVNNIADLI